MKALHDLAESGKASYIGASSMWAYEFVQMQAIAEVRRWTKVISMQNQHHLLYREDGSDTPSWLDCKSSGNPRVTDYLLPPEREVNRTLQQDGCWPDSLGSTGHEMFLRRRPHRIN